MVYVDDVWLWRIIFLVFYGCGGASVMFACHSRALAESCIFLVDRNFVGLLIKRKTLISTLFV